MTRRALALSSCAAATALLASAAPLIVYAGTLALFGFAHVVTELRYVAVRFRGRIAPKLAACWALLLLLLALARAADFGGVALPGGRTAIELALLGALLAVTALAAPPDRRIGATLAVGGAAVLAWCVHPTALLALLAFLHNLTPLGFLAEATRGREQQRERWRIGSAALAAFVVVPLLIALGVFEPLVSWFSTLASALPLDGAFLGIGPVDTHFSAFLPSAWHERDWAPRLFAAAVYLQCAHYFVVLHVLPRWLPHEIAKPRGPRFTTLVVLGLALGLALYFVRSFHDARALYGIAAAVHAFLEWPLFLALVVGNVPEREPLPIGGPA